MPDHLVETNPGSVWLMWPNAKRGPWLVRLQMALIDGRAECCGVEIRSFRETGEAWPLELPRWDESPPPLLRRTLRDLPLGQMLTDLGSAGYEAALEFASSLGGEDEGNALAKDFAPMARRGRAKSRGRRPVAPAEEIAAVYLQAYNRQQPTTAAVAKHFNIAESTAAKWVMRAREATDLLPPPANRKLSTQRKGRSDG